VSEGFQWIVNSDFSLKQFRNFAEEHYNKHKYVIFTWRHGKQRTSKQNRLQRLWLDEAAKQGDQTAEEYRAYCKLHFGVPIMRQQDEVFREKYDRIIKPLDYEQKLELMMEPFDFPVTRLMDTVNEGKYLDSVYTFFTGLGFSLTNPTTQGLADGN
jgi:hypothetical protein